MLLWQGTDCLCTFGISYTRKAKSHDCARENNSWNSMIYVQVWLKQKLFNIETWHTNERKEFQMK